MTITPEGDSTVPLKLLIDVPRSWKKGDIVFANEKEAAHLKREGKAVDVPKTRYEILGESDG